MVHGDGKVGAALTLGENPITFLLPVTPTGKKVLQAASEHLIPVALELGGKKDAMLVLEDADLEGKRPLGRLGCLLQHRSDLYVNERVYVVESR